jgi:thiol-disulfide isomerase/thioredoxin
MNDRVLLTLLLSLLFAIAAILFGYAHFNAKSQHDEQEEPLIPYPVRASITLPEFTLTDLSGNDQTSNQWIGKVRVLNFWATWCMPCREEIPDFIALQQALGAKGLQFIGIALDAPEAVRAFAAKANFNYPILIGDNNAIQLEAQLGNRSQGLPFSVIIDRKGQVIYSVMGRLPLKTLRDNVQPLL